MSKKKKAPQKQIYKLDGSPMTAKKIFNHPGEPRRQEVPEIPKKETPTGPQVVKLETAAEKEEKKTKAEISGIRPPAHRGQPRDQTVGPIEAGLATVARTLAPQLASDNIHLMKQVIDERKLAIFNDRTQVSTGYFLYRGEVDNQRFWDWIARWEMVSSQSIEGRARQHMLQAIAYAAGGKGVEVAEKPNVLARNLTNRQWKEKAVKEGKIVVED